MYGLCMLSIYNVGCIKMTVKEVLTFCAPLSGVYLSLKDVSHDYVLIPIKLELLFQSFNYCRSPVSVGLATFKIEYSK